MKTTLQSYDVYKNKRNLYAADLFAHSPEPEIVNLLLHSKGDLIGHVTLTRREDGLVEVKTVEAVNKIWFNCHGTSDYLIKTIDGKLRGIFYWARKAVEAEVSSFTDLSLNNYIKVKINGEELSEEELEEGEGEAEALKGNDPLADLVIEKTGLENSIMNLAKQIIEGGEMTDNIIKQVNDYVQTIGAVIPKVTVVEINNKKKGTIKSAGKQHKDFPKLLQCIEAGVNVALVGPAGSFKTTAAQKVAEVLKLKFYSKSVSAQTGSHEFFGYQDAQGRYVRTLFREAYESGGLFLLDEFDNGNPNVLAALNQATANEQCAFADGMVRKHEDFYVIMAGNTFGNGATQEYVGRNKIDAATLDRFAFISWGYDEELELDIAPNKDWCKKVQEFRRLAMTNKIKAVISPRATFDGGKMLNIGMDEATVTQLTIYKGLKAEEISMLS